MSGDGRDEEIHSDENCDTEWVQKGGVFEHDVKCKDKKSNSKVMRTKSRNRLKGLLRVN